MAPRPAPIMRAALNERKAMNRQGSRSTRILVAAATCAALGLALAGCSGSSSSSRSGTSATTGLNLTIEDYYSQPAAAAYDSVYTACAKQLGDTVTISHIPGAALLPKVLQQVSSRTMPD